MPSGVAVWPAGSLQWVGAVEMSGLARQAPSCRWPAPPAASRGAAMLLGAPGQGLVPAAPTPPFLSSAHPPHLCYLSGLFGNQGLPVALLASFRPQSLGVTCVLAMPPPAL